MVEMEVKPGGASNSSGGGNDVELLCKTLQHWFVDLFNYYVTRSTVMELQLDTKATCDIDIDICIVYYEAVLVVLFIRRLGGGTSSSGGGGNDVELLCKTLQVEHKLLYFDLKENPHGRYLEISEKPSPTCSTVIVPSSNISWFVDLFKYYVNSDDQQLFSLELQLDTKIFYFDIGENRRGCFLKGNCYHFYL
ncbi:hypothetical protein TanjilG_27964 [Lupinus angustifolius]|uniref:Uncharacterized protein n=1 Tax=Lupinus angustifolius TaxID=3871 RepID=A0A4P1RG10_LUPAN|nr:hypothetical protein TanjilG_27964 [Lupinus angustifolius]